MQELLLVKTDMKTRPCAILKGPNKCVLKFDSCNLNAVQC